MKPKSAITIRLSRPEDAAEVLRLKDETWLITYPNPAQGVTEADIRAHLAKEDAAERLARWHGYLKPTDAMKNWIALDEAKIVGFIAAGTGEPRNEVKALYVLPAYQRQGIGSRLLGAALGWLGDHKPVFLEVVEYNQPAIAAYSNAGFVRSAQTEVVAFRLSNGASMPQIEMVKQAKS